MTILNRMNDIGFELMASFDTYLQAAEHAIANFTGEDDINTDVIELVAEMAKQAIEQANIGNFIYARALIEGASTYVQADLDELELNDWVGEMDNQLEEYGIGSFL
jgi:hypothetical protein